MPCKYQIRDGKLFGCNKYGACCIWHFSPCEKDAIGQKYIKCYEERLKMGIQEQLDHNKSLFDFQYNIIHQVDLLISWRTIRPAAMELIQLLLKDLRCCDGYQAAYWGMKCEQLGYGWDDFQCPLLEEGL